LAGRTAVTPALPGLPRGAGERRDSSRDTIGTKDNFRRGGTLGPTVKIDLAGGSSMVDYTYGNGGLGGYADIPANIDAKPGDKIR
jgi:hypothetical protein